MLTCHKSKSNLHKSLYQFPKKQCVIGRQRNVFLKEMQNGGRSMNKRNSHEKCQFFLGKTSSVSS